MVRSTEFGDISFSLLYTDSIPPHHQFVAPAPMSGNHSKRNKQSIYGQVYRIQILRKTKPFSTKELAYSWEVKKPIIFRSMTQK